MPATTKHYIATVAAVIVGVAAVEGFTTGKVNIGTATALAGIMFALGVYYGQEPSDVAQN